MSLDAVLKAAIREVILQELPGIIRAEMSSIRQAAEEKAIGYMNTNEAAEYLDVKPEWIRKLANEGQLLSFAERKGSKKRFLKSDLDAYMVERRNGRKPVLQAQPQETRYKTRKGKRGLIRRATPA